MAGLNAALFSATRALAAHSKGLETAGKNLANINNPAYARQAVILGDRGMIQVGTQTLGMGVEAMGVKQIRDALLDRRVTRESSLTAGLERAQNVLQSAEVALGQQLDTSGNSASISTSLPGSAGGISGAVNDFFNAFESLSATPEIAQKQLLLQKAGVLVDGINTADARLEQVQTDVDEQIAADVVSVNDQLKAVAHLNGLIAAAENGNPGSAIDLRDQRQAKLEGLATSFNFETQEIVGSHGQIQILAKDSLGSNVALVDGITMNGSLAFDGTNFTGGTPATTLAFSAGALQAGVDARDGAVQDARDGLKALADQLTTAVNQAYNPTGTTGNFFAPAPARLIALNAGLTTGTIKTTDTANPGANELALAVAQLASTSFSTGSGDAIDGTPGAYFSSVVSGLGQKLSSTASQYDDQKLGQQAVSAMRDSVSGVSQDEELTDLMQYQRSFQASARYLTIVDSLMELVVTRLGAS